VSKFLAVAESLPDSARDCYDGVYRALDIYLEVNNWANLFHNKLHRFTQVHFSNEAC
jgi:hypothetical protein